MTSNNQKLNGMKAQNTLGIKFIIRKNKMKDDKVPVYVSVTINGKRVEVSLKHSIAIEDWNPKKELGKGMHPEIIHLNLYLQQVKSRLVECYRELQLQGKVPTAELVKNAFLGVAEDRPTLLKLVEYHNVTMLGILAPGTLKNYYTTEKYLKLYLRNKYKVQDYALADLSYQFITDFEHFLRSYEPLDHHKPIGNNGVMKHLERFRKLVTLGARLEWLEKDPFIHYQLKFHKTTREFLTAEELERIEQKAFSIPRLQFVRDLFVFSCYTGLAYIDAVQLKPENISIGMDGEYWISVNRQKTRQPVRIPILPKAQEVLDAYKDHPRALNAGRLFPNITNQKLNSYLKEVADLCSIQKPLTFHIARHTFATTVTLTNGVPLETVSKLLGHSSIKMTQVYAKIVEQKVSQDMRNLRNMLSQQKEGHSRDKSRVI
jgi:integrase